MKPVDKMLTGKFVESSRTPGSTEWGEDEGSLCDLLSSFYMEISDHFGHVWRKVPPDGS